MPPVKRLATTRFAFPANPVCLDPKQLASLSYLYHSMSALGAIQLPVPHPGGRKIVGSGRPRWPVPDFRDNIFAGENGTRIVSSSNLVVASRSPSRTTGPGHHPKKKKKLHPVQKFAFVRPSDLMLALLNQTSRRPPPSCMLAVAIDQLSSRLTASTAHELPACLSFFRSASSQTAAMQVVARL
ncbi:uncharacterized protein K460DRAFT_175868 [Cucurbitaria berberidis CBS 394.84]|uniref:Uncharacterized protein n=1 Tax=Cucurbitaria berberidis CBS 394.84 TaxID=1168544 RepID=A0A9P4L4V6_9PLEO|nr:uncharacterized protein K460DRAFT_175868 [Cucurbitaria berberidis CBS 394.84]KAF1841925.1 hypothetical protein K460DRAFT_175868 [Cucurbitaria berberidis CBS 394.84]